MFTIGQGMLVMHNSDLTLPRKNGAYVGRAIRVDPRKQRHKEQEVVVGAIVMQRSEPNPTIMDINRYHRAYSHAIELILQNTAEKVKRNSHWCPITLFGMTYSKGM